MYRYLLTAISLKAFSFNRFTKALYRNISNTIGQRRRIKGNVNKYVKRGDQNIDLLHKYHVPHQEDKVLELGTGWIHWHSIYLTPPHHNEQDGHL